MKITALGHSCLLLDFDRPESEQTTRILVDPWLTDHAIGDAMGRFPRVRFEASALGAIDAVFISHAHSDHLDPYTLVRLWSELDRPPVLLLPVSLSFLVPVFEEHLGGVDIHILEAHRPTPFRGLELYGFFDMGSPPSNEDDVMILVITDGSERTIIEADARLTLELPELREFVNALVGEPGIASAVFLTTENELSGTMGSRTCRSLEERRELSSLAMDEMLQTVEDLYVPIGDPDDLWQQPHLLRLVHGQGLSAPHELDPRWQRILFPVTIDQRIRAERSAAKRYGCQHQVDSLTVGAVHTITGGRIDQVEPLEGLHLLDADSARAFDASLPFFPELPWGPLRTDLRDIDQQRRLVNAVLNERFLPYLHGLGQPPVLHLLAECGGSYTVRVHYGPGDLTWDYVLSYGARCFIEATPSREEPQEAYWANDLDDFLNGRCDEFSTFCRHQPPHLQPRLWVCLATPLLNADLVSKRVQLHFERARAGLTPGSVVMPLYDTLG